MSTAIVIPEKYGYTVAAVAGTFWLTFYQMLRVARARKAAKIPYPQLYAEKAEAEASKEAHVFNCTQRAHQNTLEWLPQVLTSTLIVGLKYPVYAASLCGVWTAARFIYTIGYSTGDPAKRNFMGMIVRMLVLPRSSAVHVRIPGIILTPQLETAIVTSEPGALVIAHKWVSFYSAGPTYIVAKKASSAADAHDENTRRFDHLSSNVLQLQHRMTVIPEKMRALVIQGKHCAIVQEKPVPSIAEDEILIRTIAAAQNPTDWHHVDWFGNPGTISGCDFAGVVVKVGSGVPQDALAVGDDVAGFTHGGNYTDRGAYAEYVKAAARLVWKIPKGTISHEQAATMGCAFWTAVHSLFLPDRLGLVEPPERIINDQWIFIYGGSTSVGMFAIQLGRLAGYKILTVASPRHWDLCKSFGADVVLDYRDPEVLSKIKDLTGGSLHHALDTIATEQTQLLSVKVLGPGPGRAVFIMVPEAAAAQFRKDVEVKHTLIYTTLGLSFNLLGNTYPVLPEHRDHMAAFLEKVPAFVSSGDIKPNPVKLWDGGLDGVNAGLEYMREGKNSAAKIVHRIMEKET
ncbi:hypothetical protein NM688_g2337 [Phlebia brevispora]|uniref:Uncharacterized protein n=1 Tax=Phlebia brevispora TaxID=194682 RepID=A0ACC1T8N1_9APHY|nr:hypothetical protein NM688_g2337 [Phlebia brevispora]